MNKLTNANNIYDAGTKAIKSSTFKHSTILFETNHLLETAKIQKAITDGSYKPDPATKFEIRERGKARLISSNTMRDKAINHLLCDEVLTPSVEPLLILDNSASQKGKGVAFHRKRLVRHLRQFYSKHGNNGYILLIDFSGYYANILHGKCLEGMAEALKKNCKLSQRDRGKAIDMLTAIVDSFGSDGKGVDIGNQCSQDIGIFYPHRIDNLVKSVCGVKYYGRYTDDTYIISDNKEALKEILERIRKEAKDYGIIINNKKTRICRLSDRWRHLQIQYSLTDTGRIIHKIRPRAIARERHRLKAYKRLLDKGIMQQEDIDESLRSWLGGNYKNMSTAQIRSIIQLHHKLFERRFTWKRKHGRLRWLTEQALRGLN